MSFLELVTLGLADSKSPWAFFLHGAKLHDPRLLLHIAAFKGFGASEWVDLVIANGRCEPVSEAVCEEINSLVQKMNITPQDEYFMRLSSTERLRGHRGSSIENELEWQRSRKRDARGRFVKQKPMPERAVVWWTRARYNMLAALLLRCVSLWPHCRKTIRRIMLILDYLDHCNSLKYLEPESNDAEYLCILNDVKNWSSQFRRLFLYFKRNRKVK